jgi:hypothetical protein
MKHALDERIVQTLACLREARTRAWRCPSAENLADIEMREKELDTLLDRRAASAPATIPAEAHC